MRISTVETGFLKFIAKCVWTIKPANHGFYAISSSTRTQI